MNQNYVAQKRTTKKHIFLQEISPQFSSYEVIPVHSHQMQSRINIETSGEQSSSSMTVSIFGALAEILSHTTESLSFLTSTTERSTTTTTTTTTPSPPTTTTLAPLAKVSVVAQGTNEFVNSISYTDKPNEEVHLKRDLSYKNLTNTNLDNIVKMTNTVFDLTQTNSTINLNINSTLMPTVISSTITQNHSAIYRSQTESPSLSTTVDQSFSLNTLDSIPTTFVESTTIPSTTLSSITIPSTTDPSTTIPLTTIPSTTVPSTTVASTTIPTIIIPSTTVLLTTIPSTTISSKTAPSTTAPSTTIPSTTIPSTTLSTKIPITNIPYNFNSKSSTTTTSTSDIPQTETHKLTQFPTISSLYPVYIPSTPIPYEKPIEMTKTETTTTASRFTNRIPILPLRTASASRKHDYIIYGILPNNSVVEKSPNDNYYGTTTDRQSRHLFRGSTESNLIVYGIYPNNTVVRKYPNGTIVQEKQLNENIKLTNYSPENIITELQKQSVKNQQRQQSNETVGVDNYSSSITLQTTNSGVTVFNRHFYFYIQKFLFSLMHAYITFLCKYPCV